MQRISQKCSKLVAVSGHVVNIRHVSALYVSRDKASENYVSLQPFMDFQETFRNTEKLEKSIEKRKLSIDLKKVTELFSSYQQGVRKIDNLESEREIVAKQLKELAKQPEIEEDLITKLKERGKSLRNDLKSLKINFIPIEDEFIRAFLDLPNNLHNKCPEDDYENILYQSLHNELKKTSKQHLDYDNLIYFIDDSRYYMLDEAAEFETRCPQVLARYFIDKGNFIQTANPDFTRCVLLEANASPMNRYYKVLEENLQNNHNPSFLTGGGSFESFLGAITKLCVYPSVLPLKFVSIGRLYERTHTSNKHNLFTATQNNAVQSFVATTDPAEAEEQMDNVLNLCVDFYKVFNIQFRIVYVTAAQLMPAESLRAQIEIYSPHEKRYVVVGSVSNYKDYVSKRLLFTMRQRKDYQFLHLVGGPVLYTSRLIAALLEYGENLDYKKIVETLNIANDDAPSNAINEFKALFK